MLSRRALLQSGLVSLLLSPKAIGAAPAGVTRQSSRRRPRYYLFIILGGGMDASLTTDPKVRAEVDADVDLSYAPTDIVSSGDLRFGPLMKDIARWAPKMAVVNGVQVKTANHETGYRQILRFKTNVSDQMPGILEIIGAQRDGQPLACCSLGYLTQWMYSPNEWFGARTAHSGSRAEEQNRSIFDLLDESSPSELEMLAEIFAGHAKNLRTQGRSQAGRMTANNIEQAATLFARLEKIPRFKEERWSDEVFTQQNARYLQRTLWTFRNDLSASSFVVLYGTSQPTWDTHEYNLIEQSARAKEFFGVFDRFLMELHRSSNEHGNLLENTLIVVGSELGRFPKLNSWQGKDHFPEAPYFLLGSGINSGTRGASYGQTGRQMQALPVSLRSGRPSGSGDCLTLDDLGATLLHIANVDPTTHDYGGRILDFLVGV